jgi:hypothetical protein
MRDVTVRQLIKDNASSNDEFKVDGVELTTVGTPSQHEGPSVTGCICMAMRRLPLHPAPGEFLVAQRPHIAPPPRSSSLWAAS